MFTRLYVFYIVVYLVLSPPLCTNGWIVWLIGLTFPVILAIAYSAFEEFQQINRISVFWKVFGRWCFAHWAGLSIIFGLLINNEDLMYIGICSMLILPLMMWCFLYNWENLGAWIFRNETYYWYRKNGRDPFTSESLLNWDDPNPDYREWRKLQQ